VAASGKSVYIDEVPEGYINIISGLGTSSPRYLLITPLTKGGDVKGVLEVATFQPLTERKRKQLEEMASMLAQRLI
jgi:methyl-accepting chemotaxis protein